MKTINLNKAIRIILSAVTILAAFTVYYMHAKNL
jgi:hypothetical protein